MREQEPLDAISLAQIHSSIRRDYFVDVTLEYLFRKYRPNHAGVREKLSL